MTTHPRMLRRLPHRRKELSGGCHLAQRDYRGLGPGLQWSSPNSVGLEEKRHQQKAGRTPILAPVFASDTATCDARDDSTVPNTTSTASGVAWP